MARHKKELSAYQIKERNRIEQELSSIPKQNPLVAKIMSPEGFIDYYLSMRDLYDTQQEAYERLEDFHVTIAGKTKYAEYDSFRVVVSRYLNNLAQA